MFERFSSKKDLLAEKTTKGDMDPDRTIKIEKSEPGELGKTRISFEDVLAVRSFDLMDGDNLVIKTEDGIIYHFSIKKDLKAGVGSIACIVGPENLKGKEWPLPTNVAMIGAASIGDAPIGKVRSIKIMRLKSIENRRTPGENS